jgi:sulfide dehydrogenase cytochrome subunit
MSVMTKRTAAVVLAAALVLAGSAQAEEPGPTTETIARNCMGCHGLNGKSPGADPTIYGKSADYLVQRLAEFRDGKRDATVMNRVMKGFADEDIRGLADYYASRK